MLRNNTKEAREQMLQCKACGTVMVGVYSLVRDTCTSCGGNIKVVSSKAALAERRLERRGKRI